MMIRKMLVLTATILALSVLGGQSVLMAGLTNHGELTIESDVFGDIVNSTDATLDFGKNLKIYGSLYNHVEGTVIVFRHEIDFIEGEVQNDGLIWADWGGHLSEVLHFTNNGKIWLFHGSCHGIVFDNTSTGIIEGSGGISSSEMFRNEGVIYAARGPLLLYSGEALSNSGTLGNRVGTTLTIMSPIADVNNQGTIEVNGAGAVTFDCNLNNEPNGVVRLMGAILAAGTITQSAGATFEGFGGITGDIIIDPNGMIKLTGPTNIVGNMEIGNAATLDISDGTTLITGQTTCNGTIHMIGGRIIPQGGLSGDCNIIWEPGTYTNVADFNLDGQVNFKDFAYFADTWLWQTSWQ